MLSRFSISDNLLDLRVARTLVLGMTAFGTAGFMFLEGYAFLDALYMTIITMSTVGFGEVRPLSGAGQVFVSLLIVVNTVVFAYALAAFTYYVIEGNIFQSIYRKRMQSTIDATSDHVIVCGFGKYGREILEHLVRHNRQIVVIDLDDEQIEAEKEKYPEMLFVIGDATEDEVLEKAGIMRAKSLISALADDSDNLFIVLSANTLNPNLRIISRASTPRSRQKMLKAGADYVIMPEQIGGFYMASLISKPGAVEFFSFITNELSSDIGFEEIRHDRLKPEYRNRPIRDLNFRNQTGVNIIAYRHPDGSYLVNPGPDVIIQENGSFIVLGTELQLTRLRDYLDGQ